MEHIEDCISFLLGKAAQQVTRRTREALAPFGVTPVQYAILNVLWEQDGQSGAELGQRLVLDSATMTGLIDRLAAAGLVTRRADEADRRVNRVFLTAAGLALRAPLDAEIARVNAEVAATLGRAAPDFWGQLRRIGDIEDPKTRR